MLALRTIAHNGRWEEALVQIVEHQRAQRAQAAKGRKATSKVVEEVVEAAPEPVKTQPAP